MNEIMKAMLLQMLQSYVSMSMYAVQKQTLTQRRPNQWQIDNAFQSMFQNVPQYAMQAQQPLQQMGQGVDLTQVQNLVTQIAGNAPQQGQVAQPPPVPPAPGHWQWDDTKQDYKWIPNP